MSNDQEKDGGKKSEHFSRRESADVVDIASAKKEEPIPPSQIVALTMTITLFEDGNIQVDGPFHDRVAFHGLLAMAAHVEHKMFDDQAAKALAHRRMLQNESWIQRKMRERRERRAASDAKAAAERAAHEKDELSKSLVKK